MGATATRWPVWALIREARHRAGITQAELARRVGTSQPAIARYERARAMPDLPTLHRIVEACGLAAQARAGPARPTAGSGRTDRARADTRGAPAGEHPPGRARARPAPWVIPTHHRCSLPSSSDSSTGTPSATSSWAGSRQPSTVRRGSRSTSTSCRSGRTRTSTASHRPCKKRKPSSRRRTLRLRWPSRSTPAHSDSSRFRPGVRGWATSTSSSERRPQRAACSRGTTRSGREQSNGRRSVVTILVADLGDIIESKQALGRETDLVALPELHRLRARLG